MAHRELGVFVLFFIFNMRHYFLLLFFFSFSLASKTIEYFAPDMTCMHCVNKVTTAFKEYVVDIDSDVKVDLETDIVKISNNKKDLTIFELLKLTEKTDYPIKAYKLDNKVYFVSKKNQLPAKYSKILLNKIPKSIGDHFVYEVVNKSLLDFQ